MFPATPLLAAAPSNLPAAFQSTWEFMEKGGIFMAPLGFTAIIGTTAILFKWLSLARSRVIPDDLASRVENFQSIIDSGRTDAFFQEVLRGRSSLARLAAACLKHRGKPQSDIIQAIEATAREESSRLHAGIGVLDIVITVAPLLGLLGTASGLVTIFDGLSDAADHLGIARGIAEALNTTIFGLAIAVPCVVAHGFFTRKIETLTVRLETLLADLAHACQKPTPRD
jgi:biopolymer transport protein ExbB